MSILIVGASYRSAPVELLERLAGDADTAVKVRRATLDSADVTEALVLATCNRLEVYAEVDRFHGGVDHVSSLLAERAGVPLDDIVQALYVHYDDAATAHLFGVAAGLDSMVVGESQILGQVRDALRQAQDDQSVGPALNALFQQGLRVGKRAHAETGIDRAGPSLVSVAFDDAVSASGPLDGARVCIVGSGSVAALAATTAARRGAGSVTIASRTVGHATRLADRVGGRAVGLDGLGAALRDSDVVVSCTAATGLVVDAAVVADAVAARAGRSPLAIVDLALPHDVDPEVGELPGVVLLTLQGLAESVHNGSAADDVAAVREIVAEELTSYLTARTSARVAPTVVALRTMATG
ncbi:MAG TPA: glutamyl-tRNA reductase, partial [Nocardioidaceae bacterium]|nr:glutamyl-tRNA reductase [Nocardioidaceae bacterium]